MRIPDALKKAVWETVKTAGRIAISGAIGALFVWVQGLVTSNTDPGMAIVYGGILFLLDKLQYAFTKEQYRQDAAKAPDPIVMAQKPKGIIPF